MILAVSAQRADISSPVHNQFGRCGCFVFVDTETRAWRVLQNKSADAATGAGTACAQQLYDEKADAVISGQVGPNAYEALSGCGIHIYLAAPGLTVEEAVERFINGQLQKMEIKHF